MNVTLEVSVVDVIRAMSNYNNDANFNAAINMAIDKQLDSQDDFVTLFAQSFTEINPEGKLASIFYTPELKDKITSTSTNEEVMGVIRLEVEDAIDRSFNILRSRIDRFGVSQPNIQRLEGSGRILVELPGVKDPERVRKLLQGTAQLEFWETYENAEILGAIDQINTYLKSKVEEEETVSEVEEVQEESASEDNFDSSLSIDDLSADSEAASDSAAMTAEQFSRENPLYAVLFPNLNQSNQPNEGPVCGISSIKDTAAVNAYLKMDEVNDILPRDVRFAWTVKPYDPEGKFVQLVALKVTTRDGNAAMEGDVVTDARTDFGQFNGTPIAAISDLEFFTGTPSEPSVILRWTASGDDGYNGVADQLEVRGGQCEDNGTTIKDPRLLASFDNPLSPGLLERRHLMIPPDFQTISPLCISVETIDETGQGTSRLRSCCRTHIWSTRLALILKPSLSASLYTGQM